MAQRNAPARVQPPPADAPVDQANNQDTAQTGEAAAPPAQSDPPAANDAEIEKRSALRVTLPPNVLAKLKTNDGGRPLSSLPPIAAELLAEACYVFGINPDPTVKPLELAAFRFDPGEPDSTMPVPANITLVTAGGWKGRYPIDDDTEHKLRIVHHAYKVNRNTGERIQLPLPEDLTLPRAQVDGIVRSEDHVYQQGYLRTGGRDEAMRRAKLRELRDQGRIR